MNETEPIRTAADWHLDRVRRAGREQLRELEDIVEGYVSYFETSGHASVYLNRYDAQGIYDSLQKKDDDE